MLLSLKYMSPRISIYYSRLCLLEYDNSNQKSTQKGLKEIKSTTYVVHFISLGLQFNWSEHRPVKAEAAGSSPVSPDGSKYNKKIHQFISSFPVKERTNNITEFYSKRDLSYFFFCFHIFKIWKFLFLQRVPIDGRKTYVTYVNYHNYRQHHIQDSKEYRPGSSFFVLITPDFCNGIEYQTFSGSTYTKGIWTIQKKFNIVNFDLIFRLKARYIRSGYDFV